MKRALNRLLLQYDKTKRMVNIFNVYQSCSIIRPVQSVKVYHVNDCVDKFIEQKEDEVKQFYITIRQQPVVKLNNALKREHEAGEECNTCLKVFNNPENRMVRRTLPALQPKIPNTRIHPHFVSQTKWL